MAEVKTSFKVGEVRQIRRPYKAADGSEVPKGARFVIVSVSTVRVEESSPKHRFTCRFVLWREEWKQKKEPPRSYVIVMLQGTVNKYTRSCLPESKATKAVKPASTAYFGRTPKSGGKETVK